MKIRSRGSRRGALIAASVMGLTIPAVVGLVSIGTGFTLYNGSLLLPAVPLLWRASLMGITLYDGHLEIVSWYRRHTVDRADVISVRLMPYSGLLNRSAESGIDPLWLFCRMVCLRTRSSTRENEYPSTISSRSVAEQMANDIRDWAGLPSRLHGGGPKH